MSPKNGSEYSRIRLVLHHSRIQDQISKIGIKKVEGMPRYSCLTRHIPVQHEFSEESLSIKVSETSFAFSKRNEGNSPLCSIVIPVYNQWAYTDKCLRSIARCGSHAVSFEVVVVNNASTDGTKDFLSHYLERYGFLRVVHLDRNYGFAGACNRGARSARGKLLVFLNNDIVVLPGWLEALVRAYKSDEHAGIVGAKLIYPDRTIQHAGVSFQWIESDGVRQPWPFHPGRGTPSEDPQVNEQREVEAVTGACMMIEKSIFEQVGGFDESYFMYFEDIDLNLKVRTLGKKIIYCPESTLVHFEGQSSPDQNVVDQLNTESYKIFYSKWASKLATLSREIPLTESSTSSHRVLYEPNHSSSLAETVGRQSAAQARAHQARAEQLEAKLQWVETPLNELEATLRTKSQGSSGEIVNGNKVNDLVRDSKCSRKQGAILPSGEAQEPLSLSQLPRETCRGIKWEGAILNFSGYASHSRKLIAALEKTKIPLSVVPWGTDMHYVRQLRPQQMLKWRKLIGEQISAGAYVCHSVPTFEDGTDVFAFVRGANPAFQSYIGLTTFETDGLPPGWAKACNRMDAVWVPSTFNRETFARAGVHEEKIRVFPTGIEKDVFDPARVSPLFIANRRGFAFLSVFQWTKRKGWDVLLRAYLSAFSPHEDVCLILRTYPYKIKKPPIKQRIEQYIRSLGLNPEKTPPIILLNKFIPEPLMPSLYAAADAFVLPSRGEGFGLPYMEAMAMGLPTLATRWGGHLDYMDDNNSFLIDVESLRPVHPELTWETAYYTADQKLAEPSVTHTAELMRLVFENRAEAQRRANAARAHIVTHWTMERSARWLFSQLLWIYS